MSITMLWVAGLVGDEARAEVTRCEQPLEVRSELLAEGLTALVVRGVQAPVRLVPGGDGVGAVATACTPDRVKVKVKRTGTVGIATLSAPAGADVALVLTVPPGVTAVTVDRLEGPLEVRDVPAHVAVVSSTGPIDVTGAQSLRVGYATGPLAVADLSGSLSVDAHTGDLNATDIGGDVVVDGIAGAVTVDGVDGRLEVRGSVGPVAQSNVRGAVLTE